MSKKLLSAILTVFTIILIFPTAVLANDGATKVPGGKVTNYEELQTALGGSKCTILNEDGILILNDIELSSPIEIQSGEYVIMGAGITLSASFTDSSYIILGDGESKAALTLGNKSSSSGNDSLVLDGGGATVNGSIVYVSVDSDLKVYNGTVLKDVVSSVCGGAVYSEGSFTMYGGRIVNCRTTGSGGAIFSKGELLLPSGSISSCSAEFGGGVYSEGECALIGTEIKECTATKGGGIFNSGKLEYMSSSVSGCNASDCGGGIYNSSELYLTGGQIVSCEAELEGGGVYSTGGIVFDGTYLQGGKANSGGNIYNRGSISLKSGQIYEGSAKVCGGNIYNAQSGDIEHSGGAISQGSAKLGGGIYNLGELTVSGGSYNVNSAEYGEAVLNAGTMMLTGYPYISDRNDVAVVIDENAAHALIVGSEMKAELIARLTPVVRMGEVGQSDEYKCSYVDGEKLLVGDYARTGYSKFIVSPEGKTEWSIDNNGELVRKGTLTENPLFYLGLILAFAITVALMVICIRYFDKKRTGV